jgi:transposase InsO family protein
VTDAATTAVIERVHAENHGVRRADRDLGGLIHHSDKGVQHVAVRYTQRLADAGAVASVGSTGDSHDNALAEAFHSLFKAELVRNMGPAGASRTSRSPWAITSTGSTTDACTARSA